MKENLLAWTKSRTKIELLAYIFIVIGLCFFGLLLWDFFSENSTNNIFVIKSIGDLGTLLSGTSGIFWALAGVLLFISALTYQREDLKLQREELADTRAVLKDQGETLKLQTAETTYFRMLENHRALIESLSFNVGRGYNGLSAFYVDLKRKTLEFCKASLSYEISISSFASVSGYYPLRILASNKESVQQIFDDTLHVINFIKLKLKGEHFYHQTFYNTLSIEEKYILGMHVLNNCPEMTTAFQNEEFDYLKEYQSSGSSYYLNSIHSFFPDIDYHFVNNWIELPSRLSENSVTNNELGELVIKIGNNELGKEIKILSATIECLFRLEKQVAVKELMCDVREKVVINVTDQIIQTILPRFHADIKQNKYDQDIQFSLFVHVEYNNSVFTYKQNFDFKPSNSQLGMANISFSKL